MDLPVLIIMHDININFFANNLKDASIWSIPQQVPLNKGPNPILPKKKKKRGPKP